MYRDSQVFVYVRRDSPKAWQRRMYLLPVGDQIRSAFLKGSNVTKKRSDRVGPPIGTFVLRTAWPSAPAGPNGDAFGDIGVSGAQIDMTVADGRETGLLSERAGPTLLVIGDAACAGCAIVQRTFPTTVARLRRRSGTLTYLVGRNADGAARELAANGARDHLDLVLDNSLSVEAGLAVNSMPILYFVTPGGHVQSLFIGSMDQARMSLYLDKLLT